MNFYYLPQDLRLALNNLNLNFLTEIRLRKGQPVIIGYCGAYKYINEYAASDKPDRAIICQNPEKILYAAMDKSVYAYSEQLKRAFITVDGGCRIGIAGEYVTQGDAVITVKNITSLNIRIAHDITGIADKLYNTVSENGLKSTLIFSPTGYGKTTMLRDFARVVSKNSDSNILIIDERNEIASVGESGVGYNLGAHCDVVRGVDKLTAFANAVRALNPQLIITDELYGKSDFDAVNYSTECGIAVIASSHSMQRTALQKLPFRYFAELKGVGKEVTVYDKDFNIIGNYSAVGSVGSGIFG